MCTKKQLLQSEIPHHIANQEKLFVLHQYQSLQQQYYQYVHYHRQEYETKLQRYRQLLYGKTPSPHLFLSRVSLS